MDNFDELKQLWQKQVIPAPALSIAQLKRTNANAQRKLERQQLLSGLLLLLTGLVIVWMVFFSSIHFQSALTYVAAVLLALIPAAQGFINLSIYRRLHRIDRTMSITQHLDEWQRYYTFRKQLLRINLPLYYLLLTSAFGLYFIEILGYFPLMGRVVALSLFTAWMLFAYFVLGKRTLRRENERMEMIINNLRTMQQQLIP